MSAATVVEAGLNYPSTIPNGAVASLRDVTKLYGTTRALNHLSLISPGEVVTLLGPNGAGKRSPSASFWG
jgi:ABC-type lipopolysaccharide export system ATPase subunit